MSDMKRREFITLLGGAVAGWPLAARTQQADKVYRIGVFSSINPIMGSAYSAFLDELRVQGFIQGHNLVVDLRSTDQSPAAIASNVAEMVRSDLRWHTARTSVCGENRNSGLLLSISIRSHMVMCKALRGQAGASPAWYCGRPS